MAKQTYTQGRQRSKGIGSVGRGEHATEGGDRPFAEIRKTIHDVLRLLSLHRWAFFIPFCIVTCTAFIMSLYFPRTYRAHTAFERRNDPVMANLPMSSGAASFKYFRATMKRDLTSLRTMRSAAERMGLADDFERNEDGSLTPASRQRLDSIARSMRGSVNVTTISPNEQIDIIGITYRGPDPNIGRRLVTAVREAYVSRTMDWIHKFLTTQRDYFQAEADQALARVKETRRWKTQMRLANPLVDPANPAAIASTLVRSERERRALQLRHREYAAELTSLQLMLAALDSENAANSTSLDPTDPAENGAFLSAEAFQLRAQLQDLDRKIAQLRKTRGVTDLHPDIQELFAQRDWLDSQLIQQRQRDRQRQAQTTPLGGVAVATTAPLSPAASRLQYERKQFLLRIEAQEAKLKDLQISIDANDAFLGQVRDAEHEVLQRQEEFEALREKAEKAQLDYNTVRVTIASIEPAIKAIEQGRLLSFSEGEPASGSSRPVSPKSKSILMLALLAGIATGTGFVVLSEIFDHVYRSSGQVARSLGLPMLESIDEIVTPQDRRYLFVRRAVFAPLIVVIFAGVTSLAGTMAYLSIEQPWTYQKIRKIPDAAIRLFAGENDSRVG